MNRFFLLCILLSAFCIAACSVPNLEKPECAQARDSVRQFYSWYLGTKEEDRRPEMFSRYISPDFSNASGDPASDPYLLAEDAPKSFKVGACKLSDPDHAEFDVLLLWRDDTKTEQKGIKVASVKTGDKWLINKVVN
jgi:hypothetical protein